VDSSLRPVLRIITQILALIPLGLTLYHFWSNSVIPELAYDFCSGNTLTELSDTLEKNANDVVFVNFKHHRRRCYQYDQVDHAWLETSDRSSQALSFDTTPRDHILFRFPYAWASAETTRRWLTADPSFKVTLYKGTAYNPYTVERDVESSETLHVQGVYFVEKGPPDAVYSRVFTLRPVPYSDDVVSHMKCLYRSWHWVQKRLLCFKL
jgi:hypothetical protein